MKDGRTAICLPQNLIIKNPIKKPLIHLNRRLFYYKNMKNLITFLKIIDNFLWIMIFLLDKYLGGGNA